MNIRTLALAAGIGVAIALPATAAETRTVMWFVGHPTEMKEMLRSCRNDPGEARHVAECENVTQAELVLATNEAEAETDMTSPRDPRYWQRHPTELAPVLAGCEHANARLWHVLYCESATAAMKARR